MKSLFRHSKKQSLLIATAALLAICLLGGGAYAALGGAGKPQASSDIELQRGLVGWWKLQGNAKDSTPYGDNGTVNAATLVADRKESVNSAYSFNGTSSYITVANSTAIKPTNAISFSAWVKPTTLTTANTIKVLSATEGGGYSIMLNNTASNTSNCPANSICSFINVAGSYAVAYSSISSIAIGSWSNLTATYDGVISRLYVNGAQTNSVTASGSITQVTAPLCIGAEATNSSCSAENFNGSIDDVRIYNRAVSASEATALYKQYDAQVNAASGENGLIGWWKLDGNAKDASPNAADGTLINSPTATSDRKGQAGKALNLSYNSFVNNIPTSKFPTTAMTVSVWAKQSTLGSYYNYMTQQWVSTDGGWILTSDSGGTVTFGIYKSPSQYDASCPAAVTVNVWHHYVGTYDGTTVKIYMDGALCPTTATISQALTTTGTAFMGSPATGGSLSLDDIRLYNRALSQTEVTSMYKSYDSQVSISNLQSGLVGNWPMNGNAKDATPYSNNGTVSVATLTTDRKGRANSAYSFNGSSGYIGTGNNSALSIVGNLTLSAWVNIVNDSNYQIIVSKNQAEYELAADFRSGGTLLELRNAGGSQNVSATGFFTGYTGTWVHVAVTTDGVYTRFYRNGSLFYTTGYLAPTSGSSAVYLGSRSGTSSVHFDGSMDDVRIYNRTLSAAEIMALYNNYE